MIEELIQGRSEDEHRLYSLIGKWLVSDVVHKQLGMAITGRPGDVWLIFSDRETAVAFCQVRTLKDGSTAHIRYMFGDNIRSQDLLLREVLKLAKAKGLTLIYTNDRDASPFWETRGFAKHTPKRGVFCKFTLELKVKK
jgi:hypothetical protein